MTPDPLLPSTGTLFLWYLAAGAFFTAAYLLTARKIANTPSEGLCQICVKKQTTYKEMFDLIPPEIAGRIAVVLTATLCVFGPILAIGWIYDILHRCSDYHEESAP